jgi:hypothetical protein
MVTSPSNPAAGETLTVRVEITGAADVTSVPFHVVFVPAVLRFDHGSEGAFLGRDGQATSFFAAPVGAGGAVALGLSRLGQGAGATGNGLLCTLEFAALSPGPARLGFARAGVRDARTRVVPASFQAALVEVREPGNRPRPAPGGVV